MKKILILFVCFNLFSAEQDIQLKVKESLEAFIDLFPPKSFRGNTTWMQRKWLKMAEKRREFNTELLVTVPLIRSNFLGRQKILLLNKKDCPKMLLMRLKQIFEQISECPRSYLRFGQMLYKNKFIGSETIKYGSNRKILDAFVEGARRMGYILPQRLENLNSDEEAFVRCFKQFIERDPRITCIKDFFRFNESSHNLRAKAFQAVVNSRVFERDLVACRQRLITDSYIMASNEYIDLSTGHKTEIETGGHYLNALQGGYYCSSNFDTVFIYHEGKLLHEIKVLNCSASSISLFPTPCLISENHRYLACRTSENEILLFDSTTGESLKRKLNRKFRINGVSNEGKILLIFNCESSFCDCLDSVFLPGEVYLMRRDNDFVRYDFKLDHTHLTFLGRDSSVFIYEDPHLNFRIFDGQRFITIYRGHQKINCFELPKGFSLNFKSEKYLSENLLVLMLRGANNQNKLWIKTDEQAYEFDSQSFCMLDKKVLFFDESKSQFCLFNANDNTFEELTFLNNHFQDLNELRSCKVEFIGKPAIYIDKPFVVFSMKRIHESASVNLNREETFLYDFKLDLLAILPDKKIKAYDWHQDPSILADIYLDLGNMTPRYKRSCDQPSTLEAALVQDEPK